MNDLPNYNFYKQNYKSARKIAREYYNRYIQSLNNGSSNNIINYLYKKYTEKNLIYIYSEYALNELVKARIINDSAIVDEMKNNIRADYNAAEYIFNNGIDIKRNPDNFNYGYIPPLDLGPAKSK